MEILTHLTHNNDIDNCLEHQTDKNNVNITIETIKLLQTLKIILNAEKASNQ